MAQQLHPWVCYQKKKNKNKNTNSKGYTYPNVIAALFILVKI